MNSSCPRSFQPCFCSLQKKNNHIVFLSVIRNSKFCRAEDLQDWNRVWALFFSTRSTQPIWSGKVPEWSFATFDCSVMQRFSTLVTGNHFPAQFKIFPGSHTPDPSNELIMTPPVSWIRCVRECLKLCSRESLYNWSREPMPYCWTLLNISVQPAWGLVFGFFLYRETAIQQAEKWQEVKQLNWSSFVGVWPARQKKKKKVFCVGFHPDNYVCAMLKFMKKKWPLQTMLERFLKGYLNNSSTLLKWFYSDHFRNGTVDREGGKDISLSLCLCLCMLPIWVLVMGMMSFVQFFKQCTMTSRCSSMEKVFLGGSLDGWWFYHSWRGLLQVYKWKMCPGAISTSKKMGPQGFFGWLMVLPFSQGSTWVISLIET